MYNMQIVVRCHFIPVAVSTQHTINTRNDHLCPQRDSSRRSQQLRDCRPAVTAGRSSRSVHVRVGQHSGLHEWWRSHPQMFCTPQDESKGVISWKRADYRNGLAGNITKFITDTLHQFLNIKALPHVSANIYSHLQGVPILKDVCSIVIQLCQLYVSGKMHNTCMLLSHSVLCYVTVLLKLFDRGV